MASFLTLERDTKVVDRFGEPVGHVERVLTVREICHFDGLIVRTPAGSRFVDAPEVRRIEDDEVELSIARSDVEFRGPRSNGVPSSRIGRTGVTDDDRHAVDGPRRDRGGARGVQRDCGR